MERDEPTTASGRTHWADEVAAAVVAGGRDAVLSTGISPSGEIHIGNMREVLTADAVYRALVERGSHARFHYVADNFDPLRRVYPFLDPARYEPHVGRPLSAIPCPCGAHASYAEHFLAPFLDALERLHVDVEVVRADELYRSGRMVPWIVRALDARERIAAIFAELTGRETGAEWSPFQPVCTACARLTSTRVTGHSAAAQTVDYACACGSTGTVSMAGGGKLTWRVDWPARWMALGVTVEPFGKDHATRGGSYDTGARIIREVFGGEPPHPIPYEWIQLRGKGDMSSSKGNVLAIHRMLDVVPPEVLRYFVLRERPQRSLTFDPGLALVRLVDEVDDASASRDERALELSLAGGFEPVGVPFAHVVVVAQVARFDADTALAILARTGYPHVSRAALERRLFYARNWLRDFAPDEHRFEVQAELPAAVRDLTAPQRRFLATLADRLRDDMGAEAIHALVYDLAKAPEISAAAPAELFAAIYLALLGKPRGPRAGWFLALLGPARAAERFREAAAAQAAGESLS
jgi:lysyl-tRNA synthetase class 1